MADQSDNWSLYPYHPVKALPIIFAIIIFSLGILHVYQSFFKYRWKKFGLMMLWATSVWVAGFICRAISVHKPQAVGIFIAQFVLIIFAPPLYAAAEYFILGRLLAYLPYHSPIHPGRVVSTFFLLSGAVEGLTANGAAESSGTGRTPSQRTNGLNCIKAGLLLQAIIEASFFSLVALLEYRCRKAGHFPRNVRTVCYVLYITSVMMLLRCIVRAIEGFEAAACDPNKPGYDGYCGPVQRQEWFLWVFEVANITIFVALLAFLPPGRYLPRSTKIYLDPYDWTTERIGPGYSRAEGRSRLATVLDPFDIVGVLTGKGKTVEKFWEQSNPTIGEEGQLK
jgi:hypothetical protein